MRRRQRSMPRGVDSGAKLGYPRATSEGDDGGKPRTIGPYHLMRRLGVGGMGQVWLAEQVGPGRRYVAVKVVKPGGDDDAGPWRFQAGRQAPAILGHPPIAQVFDA